MKKIIIIVMFLILISTLSSNQARAFKCTIRTDNNIYESQQLVNLINQYRSQNGRSVLYYDRGLTSTASAHKAYEYSLSRTWAHNINGKTWDNIYRECGLNRPVMGENLAKGFATVQSSFIGWVNSPSHRSIMLDKTWSVIGVYRAGSALDWYTVASFTN